MSDYACAGAALASGDLLLGKHMSLVGVEVAQSRDADRRLLWGKARNERAFPGCDERLIEEFPSGTSASLKTFTISGSPDCASGTSDRPSPEHLRTLSGPPRHGSGEVLRRPGDSGDRLPRAPIRLFHEAVTAPDGNRRQLCGRAGVSPGSEALGTPCRRCGGGTPYHFLG